jgi:alanine-glyoxylate transaminase/(R)-3-amino-2-methylpropionate-pyruvate transaminase
MVKTAAPPIEMPPCDYTPAPYQGPTREQVLKDRRRYCNPAIFTYYSDPLMVVEGHRQYLFDHTGRRYLDLLAGIATVSCGHGHPLVLRRVREQMARLQHATTIYLHPNFSELAKRLAATLPPGLDVAYFTNSGSEATDLAVTLARLATGNSPVVAVRGGYHGVGATPMGLTALHTWKFPVLQGSQIFHTVNPHPYRSRFKGTPAEIAEQSVEEMHDLIRSSTPGRVAAFIAEPIQGAGGVTYGAPNYLGLAYELTRRHGGLCIADEVQTGFGRTGHHFWGFQNFDVIPDIVTVAKAFGNGMPLAAVITRREIAEPLAQKLHFNTFGGNPVAMAAGLAVLEVMEKEGLQENARKVGAHFKSGLERLSRTQPLIGEVRGLGLMLGVELVGDRSSKEPASNEAAQVLEETRRRGVLLGKGGLFGNVLRIKAPLCLTEADVDFALDVLDRSLTRVADAS